MKGVTKCYTPGGKLIQTLYILGQTAVYLKYTHQQFQRWGIRMKGKVFSKESKISYMEL